MSNVFGEDTVRRFFILVLGSFLLLSIFYEFKNNLDKFIWLISLLVLICAIYSIFQFHFDITFFEYFRRHYSYELNGVSITREWDVGASGTFSYPVPYGYFMASVYPLIYVHLIKIWRHQLSQYQKSLLVLYGVLISYALIISMQRASILIVLVSISLIELVNASFKRSFYIFILGMVIVSITFGFIQDYRGISKDSSSYKSFVSIDDVIDRLRDQSETYSKTNTTQLVLNGSLLNNKLNLHKSVHNYYLNLIGYYGFFGAMLVVLFYISLILYSLRLSILNVSSEDKLLVLSVVLSLSSYNFVSLFHNNGHFILDIVGWLTIGFFLCIYHELYSKYNISNV